MGHIHTPPPALVVLSAFSRYTEALTWAREQATRHWGPIALESPVYDFLETTYYEPTMGAGLQKVFYAFEQLRDPAELPEIKIETNAWEEAYAALGLHTEPRPLNLDPGYLTLGKLVLASTKDHSHRVYLRRGIYGEVTLHYRDNAWRQGHWTFPDYRREDYHQFFSSCRDYLRARGRTL